MQDAITGGGQVVALKKTGSATLAPAHASIELLDHIRGARAGWVPASVRLDGDRGFAPLAIERGIPLVAAAAERSGVAVLLIRNSFHFAALWPEVEALADLGLVGLACTGATAT